MRRHLSTVLLVGAAAASTAFVGVDVGGDAPQVEQRDEPTLCVRFADTHVPGTDITIEKRYDNVCVSIPSTKPYRP